MFPISAKAATALRESWQMTVTVDLWYNGSFVNTLPVIDGTVTIDRTAQVRRQCSITIGDPSFVPLYAKSALAPYGAELRVYAAINYQDTADEAIPLGVFRVQDVSWDEATGSLPVVTGADRSQGIIDAKFLMPQDRSGQGAQNTIARLIGDVSTAQVLFDPTLIDYTLPGGSTFDSERWSAIQTIAQGMGAEAYFDVQGNCVVVPVPALTQSTSQSAAVWTIDAGSNGVLVAAKRGVTRVGVYNAVSVQGTATNGNGAPPIGFAADTDPRSPTYWGPASALPFGPFAVTPFGQSVYRMTNTLITTVQQCTTAATAQLANFLGLARSLDFTCGPNPALDGGDIILVSYLNGQTELHLVDKLTVPLGPSSTFQGSTRTLTYQASAGT